MKFRNLVAFGCGLVSWKAYEYGSPFFRNTVTREHSFTSQMEQNNFEQPTIIDMLHKSQQMHFLHNFIIQSELKVLNFLKVYLPKDMNKNILGDTMTIEQKKDYWKVHLVFNATDSVQGHEGIIHGGLLATLFDNAFGYLGVAASGLVPVATAYLNVTYRKPVKTNQDYVVTCEIKSVEGRKILMKGYIKDQDGLILTEAEALFLTVNWGKSNWAKIKQTITT